MQSSFGLRLISEERKTGFDLVFLNPAGNNTGTLTVRAGAVKTNASKDYTEKSVDVLPTGILVVFGSLPRGCKRMC